MRVINDCAEERLNDSMIVCEYPNISTKECEGTPEAMSGSWLYIVFSIEFSIV